ncbi:hypothetical protein D3C76_1549260 [compost metagenome]
MGAMSGKMIFQNVPHVVAPSTNAASSSATGMDRMYPTYTKTLNARPYTVCSRIRPTKFVISSDAVSLTIGSMMIGNGMNIALTK